MRRDVRRKKISFELCERNLRSGICIANIENFSLCWKGIKRLYRTGTPVLLLCLPGEFIASYPLFIIIIIIIDIVQPVH
jgi:hypothetical protein